MRVDREIKAMLTGIIVAAIGIVSWSIGVERPSSLPSSEPSPGYRLVSVQKIPELAEVCLPARPREANQIGEYEENYENRVLSLLRGTPVYAASQESGQTVEINRQPVRRLWDTDPSIGSIAFDARLGKVFLQDLNLWAIRIYDRMTNTPANAVRSEPERIIQGQETGLQFNTCMYIDPVNGDIYTVENDVGDSISVFSQDASGNVRPKRTLDVTHRAHTITVDEERQELFVTVNYPPH